MSSNYIKKQVYFKAYKNLSQLENALNLLKEENTFRFQVSILGKVTQFFSDKDIETTSDTGVIKTYWKDLLGKTVHFGSFYNTESGFLFVAGALTPAFLYEINGKSLVTLSSGPYGILRGLGMSGAKATNYLKLLNNGNYLLIFRDYKTKIQELDELLNSKHKSIKNRRTPTN